MGRLGHSTPGAALRYQHAAADRDQVIAEALSQAGAMDVTRSGAPRRRPGPPGPGEQAGPDVVLPSTGRDLSTQERPRMPDQTVPTPEPATAPSP